jgi:hypothetical protein
MFVCFSRHLFQQNGLIMNIFNVISDILSSPGFIISYVVITGGCCLWVAKAELAVLGHTAEGAGVSAAIACLAVMMMLYFFLVWIAIANRVDMKQYEDTPYKVDDTYVSATNFHLFLKDGRINGRYGVIRGVDENLVVPGNICPPTIEILSNPEGLFYGIGSNHKAQLPKAAVDRCAIHLSELAASMLSERHAKARAILDTYTNAEFASGN